MNIDLRITQKTIITIDNISHEMTNEEIRKLRDLCNKALGETAPNLIIKELEIVKNKDWDQIPDFPSVPPPYYPHPPYTPNSPFWPQTWCSTTNTSAQ